MCFTDEQAKEIVRKVAEIPRIQDTVNDMERELTAVKVTVCGNGKEGLVAVVLKHTLLLEHHQQEYTELKKRMDKKDDVGDNRNWALWMVVIGTAINIVIGLIK